MNDRAEAMVLASFAAESYLLSVTGPYPHGRQQFSACGLRTYELLEALAATGVFAGNVIAFTASPAAATDGEGSLLAPAASLAPLAFLHRDDLESLTLHARVLAGRWGSDPERTQTTEFFAMLIWNALNAKPPSVVVASLDTFPSTDPGFVRTTELITEHEGNLREALEAVAADHESGDSIQEAIVARGIVVATVLAAFHGTDAIPDEWMSNHPTYERVSARLEDLEAQIKRRSAAGRRSTPGPTSLFAARTAPD